MPFLMTRIRTNGTTTPEGEHLPACQVCEGKSREDLVEMVFRMDGRFVPVGGIPVAVCIQCGEEIFSRDATEKVCSLLYGDVNATRHVAMNLAGISSGAPEPRVPPSGRRVAFRCSHTVDHA